MKGSIPTSALPFQIVFRVCIFSQTVQGFGPGSWAGKDHNRLPAHRHNQLVTGVNTESLASFAGQNDLIRR